NSATWAFQGSSDYRSLFDCLNGISKNFMCPLALLQHAHIVETQITKKATSNEAAFAVRTLAGSR
ncbi:hypothetical protein, partial [Diaphorobacter nitroreducens]|uniref:hypothetical protein n=1 Tax=Diaphorobacter nitroreducens TaxID=164759 RepID=UPI0028AC82DC